MHVMDLSDRSRSLPVLDELDGFLHDSSFLAWGKLLEMNFVSGIASYCSSFL